MFKVKTEIVVSLVLAAILTVIGFFLKETFLAVKGLEKDIAAIREKMMVLEATRITRNDIKDMIAEYHSTHPCIRGAITQEKK